MNTCNDALVGPIAESRGPDVEEAGCLSWKHPFHIRDVVERCTPSPGQTFSCVSNIRHLDPSPEVAGRNGSLAQTVLPSPVVRSTPKFLSPQIPRIISIPRPLCSRGSSGLLNVGIFGLLSHAQHRR